MADSTVHLYVTEELINEIGKEKKVDCQNFIKAIKRSVGERGICQKALDSWENWKYRRSKQGLSPLILAIYLYLYLPQELRRKNFLKMLIILV